MRYMSIMGLARDHFAICNILLIYVAQHGECKTFSITPYFCCIAHLHARAIPVAPPFMRMRKESVVVRGA